MKTCERTRVKKYKGVVVILCSCVRLEQFMNEKFIEQKLVEAVKKAGGLAPKFGSYEFSMMVALAFSVKFILMFLSLQWSAKNSKSFASVSSAVPPLLCGIILTL